MNIIQYANILVEEGEERKRPNILRQLTNNVISSKRAECLIQHERFVISERYESLVVY